MKFTIKNMKSLRGLIKRHLRKNPTSGEFTIHITCNNKLPKFVCEADGSGLWGLKAKPLMANLESFNASYYNNDIQENWWCNSAYISVGYEGIGEDHNDSVDGIPYTDDGFEADVEFHLKKYGFKFTDFGNTEQGMQSSDCWSGFIGFDSYEDLVRHCLKLGMKVNLYIYG